MFLFGMTQHSKAVMDLQGLAGPSSERLSDALSAIVS